MNLIEQLGGYENVSKHFNRVEYHAETKIFIGEWFGFYSMRDLKDALLEHRRQHNIYEIDDYVVYQGDAGLSGLFRIEKLTKTGKPKSVKSNRFGGFPCRYCEVRHATDEEIKAGRRL